MHVVAFILTIIGNCIIFAAGYYFGWVRGHNSAVVDNQKLAREAINFTIGEMCELGQRRAEASKN